MSTIASADERSGATVADPTAPRFAWKWRAVDPHRAGLAIVLLAALGLRLWGVKQGLPYSYNSDEAAHFLPRAIGYFSHDLNPNYFLNPPAYGYLVHIVLELWYGSADAVVRGYVQDPTGTFVVARVVAAVLGTIAVWLTYLAGARLMDRTVGLLGAAVLSVAFLPVFYSHLALNDVPTMAPVTLALYGVSGVLSDTPRMRHYLIAALGIGLAAATKYTGAIMFVCLLCACGCDAVRSGDPVRAGRRIALAVLVTLGAFIVANPYAVLDFSRFHADVSKQQALAAGQDPVKLGTTASSGTAFYLWVFTWGLGWMPSLGAVGGAALLLRRRCWALAVTLIPAVIAFVIYMGDQQRFFGRWLIPVFPIVALLGAYGAVALVRWLASARRVPAVAAGTLVTIGLLAQGVATTLHNDRVLSRPDTRQTTRDWMVGHIPAGAKIVVEPVVPTAWSFDTDPPGRGAPPTPSGARWQLWDTSVSTTGPDGRVLPNHEHRYVALDEYERSLRPALIQSYERADYCWVVVSSLQAGRAFAQPGLAPNALRYYAALANQARLVYQLTPFSSRRAVPFSFDWSIDYYPIQYTRPGPEMSIYRLTAGRCAAPTGSAAGSADQTDTTNR